MELSEVIYNSVETFKDLPNIEKYYVNNNNIKNNSSISIKDEILNAITELSYKFSENMIFYGGVLCYPEFCGYKKHLRLPSDDLDCVLTNEGLKLLKDDELLNHCYYVKEFDAGFMVYKENVPVGLSHKHIHDWTITDDFFDSAIDINNSKFCSPEYLTMLKLRRNHYRINNGKKLMGKDYMDIVSLFASETNISLEKIKDLIIENISDNLNEIKEIVSPLEKYVKQAKESRLRVDNFLKLF